MRRVTLARSLTECQFVVIGSPNTIRYEYEPIPATQIEQQCIDVHLLPDANRMHKCGYLAARGTRLRDGKPASCGTSVIFGQLQYSTGPNDVSAAVPDMRDEHFIAHKPSDVQSCTNSVSDPALRRHIAHAAVCALDNPPQALEHAPPRVQVRLLEVAFCNSVSRVGRHCDPNLVQCSLCGYVTSLKASHSVGYGKDAKLGH